MFVIIPLLIALVSSAGISIIAYRKMPYLRRLDPEAHPMGASIWYDFFPELVNGIRGVNVSEYKRASLVELEKVLRRFRIVFSAVDRFSDSLIKAVRREHLETALKEETNHRQEPEAPAPELPAAKRETGTDTSDLKQQEQELIVAIAQDPKNAALYQKLARVYLDIGNFSDALESLQAAAKLEPDNETVKKELERIADRES